MANATMRSAPRTTEEPKKQKTVVMPVRYGGLTAIGGAAGILVSIRRTECTLDEAERLFCGKVLTLRLIARPDGAAGTQPELAEEWSNDIAVSVEASCRRFSTSPIHFSTKLTFPAAGIDLNLFKRFAGKGGVLEIEHVANRGGKP